MISKEQYEKAKRQKEEAQKIINQFFKEKQERFDERMRINPIFTDDELFYAAAARCPCGHGLAYPKECGANHYWDCSAVLKGIADMGATHTAKLPFAIYDVKGECDYRGTTRTKAE